VCDSVVANLPLFSVQEELEQLDRALLTKLKTHHPQAFRLITFNFKTRKSLNKVY